MKANILLVDSVRAYREALAAHLRAAGYGVGEADGLSAASQAAARDAFDVIILDSELADAAGLAAVRSIREQGLAARIILVAGPGGDLDALNAGAQHLGISLVARGPLRPALLEEHVEMVLRGAASEAGFAKLDEPLAGDLPAAAPTDASAQGGHLADLRRSYQAKLPGEIDKLARALERAAKAGADTAALEEAHRQAHTLHGTAGTLGFDEISDAVHRIDELVKKGLAAGGMEDEDWRAVREHLERGRTAPERMSLVDTQPRSRSVDVAAVLVVSADEQALIGLAGQAEKQLIRVIVAGGRDAALEAAGRQRFDGAVADIDLAGALDLVRELRERPGASGLPFATLSSSTSLQSRVAAAHAGASHFLKKPLQMDDLAEVVRYFASARSMDSARVLIVDDDEHFRAHVASLLWPEGMEVETLGEPEKVLDVAERFRPEIIVLDVVMPEISGFDVCRLLRSTTTWKNTPILFLTAESSPKVRLECFRAGADDYIEKPVIKEELLARIGVRVERIRLFKERADCDALTALPNRRAFLEMLRFRLAEGRRYGRPVSLCLLDIDRFKHVNDTFGHLAGDRALSGLGRLLSSRFRAVDVRGRWGGEEFVVAFYGEEPETAELILGRVLEEFRALVFEGDHGERFTCSFSAGIAAFPRHGASSDELLRAADERMYQAKDRGRNRICI